MVEQAQLTQRRIFLFWAPLAATWLMMATEGPFLAGVIARLPEPKFNLAAYGIAFAIGMIVEAPIIMILSATVALLKGKNSLLKLRNFTFALNAAITVVMLVILIPPVFALLTHNLMELPPEVANLTYTGTALLLPWPAAIGFRRFYQGILIRNNQTRLVAYGTLVRLGSMAATASFLALYTTVHGIVVGTAGLSAGVVGEAIVSYLLARRYITQYNRETPATAEPELTYRAISVFYYPLALTSLIGLAVNPLTTFFVGHGRFPLESLAVLPVVSSLVFVFRSFGFAFQEVGIAMLGERFENYRALQKFATILGITTTSVLAIIAFTPVYALWFHDISGLSPTLTSFAQLPTQILFLLPGLSVLLSWQRSILVTGKNNTPISWSTAIEVVLISIVLFTLIYQHDVVGATAAAIALMVGRVFANLYLGVVCRSTTARVQATAIR